MFRPVDRHEIVKEKSIEELNAQLVSLVGENGAEMLTVPSEAGKAYQALSCLDKDSQPRDLIRQSCLNTSKEHKIQ